MSKTALPIHEVLPGLLQRLSDVNNAVLIAPPGAGKTTAVPPALLDQPWLAGRRVIMLEPRRLAARNAAAWMASQLGEPVGQTIGYRMRNDSKVSAHTRVEVVTEGLLTRLLQSDPELSAYGAVLFDEFHERSLHADLALALCLEVQQTLRADLRLLVMSATLEGEPVANLLGDTPVVRSAGRAYPVDIRYGSGEVVSDPVASTVAAVERALQQESGSVLVFLPGYGEIQRVYDSLQQRLHDPLVSVHPLFGDMSLADQEQAIAAAPGGRRKVVLATAIAETSLTIDGVRVVVDAGLTRKPSFDQRSGMTRLQTLKLSRAAADQRCGRAGRLEPGVCYRLWSESVQQGLVAQAKAEILEADLAPLVLELAQWGVTDPKSLAWLDPPPKASYDQAVELLRELAALDEQGRITAHGQAMQELGLHPRLAHLLLLGRDLGHGSLACDLAALLSERDLLRLRGEERQCDLRLRLEALRARDLQQRFAVDRGALQRIRQSAQLLRKRLAVEDSAGNSEVAGLLVALAYPDRIAARRGKGRGRYLLSNGKGALVQELDPLAEQPFLAVAELDGAQREARVFLAAPISEETLQQQFAHLIARRTQVSWDEGRQGVVARDQVTLGSLVLSEQVATSVTPEQMAQALVLAIREQGLACLPWGSASESWRQRVQFLRRIQGDEWPDVGDEALLANLETWLLPYLTGMRRLADLKSLHLVDLLNNQLDWPQQQRLDRLAPTHITVPSGSRIAIDYGAGEIPVLAVRLQEMFGLRETPSVVEGKVPLLLHLLSPARRPIQVTRDIMSFWQNTYTEVKKDLKGRYPKHVWPDDPLTEQATSRAKPRKS